MYKFNPDDIQSLRSDLSSLLEKLDQQLDLKNKNLTKSQNMKFSDEAHENNQLIDTKEAVIIGGILLLWCYSIAR